MSNHILAQLINDEAGFIVSAELVLVATIAVVSMVVGLAEVASGVNQELEDVGAAIGSVNQSFAFQGFQTCKAQTIGSCFGDNFDNCDSQFDIALAGTQHEGHGRHHNDW